MGTNHPLGWAETLLGFRGRIGRLAYLGLTLLVSACGIVIALAVLAGLGARAARPGGFALVAVPLALVLWPLTALLAKRLQDMNRSGLHAIWLSALWYLPSLDMVGRHIDPAMGMALGLVGLVAFLGVLFAPGTEGPNRYGLKPGMRVVRPAVA